LEKHALSEINFQERKKYAPGFKPSKGRVNLLVGGNANSDKKVQVFAPI
jgi:hypothetical protein